MRLIELAQLVYEMRDAQQEYFNKRTRSTLQRAKDLERRVDRAVLQVLGDAVTATQTGLFERVMQ